MNSKTVILALLLFPLVALGETRLNAPGTIAPVKVGPGIHLFLSIQRETADWQAAVIANGGTFNATDTRAVDYFVRETKAKGIWPLLDWAAIFAGRNLNAALVPLKRTLGGVVISNNNFVEGDFSPALGLTGNGSSKNLNTGINRDQCRASNDVSLGVYITVPQEAEVLSGLMGTSTSGNLHVYTAVSQLAMNGRVNSSSAISGAVAVTKPSGLCGISRIPSQTSSVVFSLAGEGSLVLSTGIATSVITVFARNTTDFYSGTLGGAWFGGGLTLQQRADFSAIWNQTMAILGRPTP